MQGGNSPPGGRPGGQEGGGSALREALLEAFSAASQNRERYEVYAARAGAQHFPQIARLFRAAARGEALHAQRHLKAAREVGPVAANLQSALALEALDVDQRYPSHRQLAAQAGHRRAERAFEFAEGANRVHQALFEEAAASVAQGRDLAPRDYLLCKVCGYLELSGTPPEFCPVCGSPAEVFSLVQ